MKWGALWLPHAPSFFVKEEGGEGDKGEEWARPGLQDGVAREVPGEEGEEDPGKPQEGQEKGPALPGVGGPAPGGQVERRKGPGKLHLVEDPGEAVAHGPEAPGPVDLDFKAAEGAAQDLAPVLPVGFGFPFGEEGDGGELWLSEEDQAQPLRRFLPQDPPHLLGVSQEDEGGEEEEEEEGGVGAHPQGAQDGEKEEDGEKGQNTAALGP